MRQNARKPLLQVLGLLILGGACAEQPVLTSPVSAVPIQANRSLQYSDDFYPDGTGYYWWNGQPPAGDLSPADISAASASAHASQPNSWTWVSGHLTHDGDQWKTDLIYSVQHNGSPVYSNSAASSGWRWTLAPYSRMQVQEYFTQNISLPEMWQCDVSVQAGGTAHSRKAIPFGISISLIKPTISLNFGTIHWGDASRPMLAASDPGVDCNEVTQVSNPTGPSGGGSTQWAGWYGGRSSPGGFIASTPRCIEWVHWFISYDGGESWYYTGSECTVSEM